MDPMFEIPERTRRVPVWRLALIIGLSLLGLVLLAF
ncbi:MAG: hypothetical protein Q27BPR15_07000 [Rhodobacter sp. CACIA14H1]|nr:MAG: hypothetical protein Q27BPR15_07000 [Rhodobacter sp. CACIA14H1]